MQDSSNRNLWIIAVVAVVVICFFLLYHFAGGMRGSGANESQSTVTNDQQNSGTPGDTGATPAPAPEGTSTASAPLTGPAAANGSTITVNYTLKLANGQVADTSVGRGPFSFTLGAGQVIAGWDKGLLGARAGQHLNLVVPPEDGYGSVQGHPLQKETLYFDIDVVSVK